LARALLLSIAIHLSLYGIWSAGSRYHVWQRSFLPSWLFPVKKKVEIMREALQKSQDSRPREIPLRFVDVSPQQATPDAPENTPFYAPLNSRAANPTRDTISDQPKISGEQTLVFRTEDVPKSQPLQPTLPRPTPAEPVEPQTAQPKEESRPQPPVGDLALNRPSDAARETKGDAEKPQEEKQARQTRPRTLAEAMARKGIQGQRVKQSGGVVRLEDFSAVNAKASIVGSYDATLIAAVQSHWYRLIDQTATYNGRSGRVVVDFRLLPDGTVTNLKISEESVGELLSLYCQLAISDAAPFGKWPPAMRRDIGDFRDVHFTFYYQ
jgi:outer membrane biosynthesis protein TonB